MEEPELDAGGNVRIGGGLDRINASETAAGVNGEKVEGTLTWYVNEDYSREAGTDYVFAGSEGNMNAEVSLNLSTNRITTEDPLPDAELVYTGVLKGESLTPETEPVFSVMPETAEAGIYVVRWENSEEILTAAKALAGRRIMFLQQVMRRKY